MKLLLHRLVWTTAFAVVTTCQGQELTSVIQDPRPEVLPFDPKIAESNLLPKCPLMPDCCEEDCCGPNTVWSDDSCIPSEGAPGFDGTYSDAYKVGCHPRACCGEDCCGEGTEYDDETTFCIPTAEINTAGQGPSEVAIETGGNVGDPCYTNDECITDSCVFDPPNPEGLGRCSCNPEMDDDGCEGDFECKTSSEIGAARGVLISVAPHCRLPVGATCAKDYECLTDKCDETTSVCACNAFTNWPCKVEIGEACVPDDDGSHVCKKVIGDGSLGSTCVGNGDCDSEYCNYGMWSMGLGKCSCNPSNNAGCTGDYKCFPDLNMVGIADADPTCYLPFGASCTPGKDKCVTFNCDEATNKCGCDTAVQYPCDRQNGEQCIFSEETGHVCQELTAESVPDGEMGIDVPKMEVGDGSLGAACFESGDCDSAVCNFGMLYEPGRPGRCVCNAETNAGCTGDYVCLANLEETQRIADYGPACYLPYGSPCQKGDKCSTGKCDGISGKCSCNSLSNYPCKDGEVCVYDNNKGNVCKVPFVEVPVVDESGSGMPIAGGMEAPDEVVEIPEIGMAIPAPIEKEKVEVGDGSLGSDCYENDDCDSQSCHYGFWFGGAGKCGCNTETNAGCDGEYQCSGNLIETQRKAVMPPGCYLPHDAVCDPRNSDCLSGHCDKVTEKCSCSTISQWPCKPDKICVRDEEEGHVCEELERTLGSACLVDKHCDSGSCYRDPQISYDSPGFCVCTPKSGCEDGRICASGSDLFAAQMLMDAPPRCVLGVGEACDPAQQRSCLSGVCNNTTELCACNPDTNYGCDAKKEEICIFDEEENKNVCQATRSEGNKVQDGNNAESIGIDNMPAPPNCPISTAMCAMIYEPVTCNGCQYGNQCEATGASKMFTKETCEKGPPP